MPTGILYSNFSAFDLTDTIDTGREKSNEVRDTDDDDNINNNKMFSSSKRPKNYPSTKRN